MVAGDPLLLEGVLLRHKRLRLFVMHAGWPRIDEMIALQRLVDGGFAGRIMFGSDFADQVESGIQAIVDAPFLSAEQKAEILCGNAARFLRLPASVCVP
jgi:predicted TIM-barrel fold metal-dependent hydrolase